MLQSVMLSVVILNVANKSFTLSVVILNVAMLSVKDQNAQSIAWSL